MAKKPMTERLADDRDPALPAESYQVDLNDPRPVEVVRAEQAAAAEASASDQS